MNERRKRERKRAEAGGDQRRQKVELEEVVFGLDRIGNKSICGTS